MVTNKARTKKNKKTLRTTLGRAPNHNEVNDDLSQVLKPIETSIYGIRQLLTIFQKGTEEMKNYLTFECDILFECRICRSIFRSLANLVLHKRNYCRERFHNVRCYRYDEEESSSRIDENDEAVGVDFSSEISGKNCLNKVIEKLKEKQQIKDLSEQILKEDLSREDHNENHLKKISSEVLLEKISTNNAAVFQTVLENLPNKSVVRPDLMRSEVMEIHGILDKNEAVLDQNGKITEFETNKLNENPIIPKNDLVCRECGIKFSTKKTLTYHLKYKHNNSRLVYICPECKNSFANAWSVFRHLLRIHRKTNSQIKRMRQQIHNSVVRRDEETCRKKHQQKQEDKITDDENQWLDNIESDKDFQMCGGCGKRFERKAALQSHVQMCTKRIAVCNTIKENNAKKKEEEYKDFKIKLNRIDKVITTEKRKGASKRKPYSLRTYKPDADIPHSVNEKEFETVLGTDVLENNCDIEVIAHTEYSEEFIENNSSGKGNCLMSSLLETMDTEKMLSIIGIPESHVKISQSTETCRTNSKASQNICDNEKDIKIEESSTTHSARDFDTFCSNIADNFDRTENVYNSSFEDALLEEKTVNNLESNMSNTYEKSVPKNSAQTKKGYKRKHYSPSDKDNVKIKSREEFTGSSNLHFIEKAEPYINRNHLECVTCQVRYNSVAELLWHMSAHFSWFRYQCSRCSFISWDKSACDDHAIVEHNVKKETLNSVVLEIPDWKIGLMSHEFTEFVDDSDLSGKHTDEIIIGLTDEPIENKDNKDHIKIRRFIDESDVLFSEIDNKIEPSDKHLNYKNDIFKTDNIDIDDGDNSDIKIKPSDDNFYYKHDILKTDSIDIDDEDNDTFLIDVPEEIISLHNDDSIEFIERFRLKSPISIEVDSFTPTICTLKDEIGHTTKKNEGDSCGEKHPNMLEVHPLYSEDFKEDTNKRIDVIESLDSQDVNIKMKPDFVLIPPLNDSLSKNIETIPIVRSTRNRIPSIKTSQIDFLYDLNGVIKMNNSTMNPKQKKNVQSSGNQRNLKDSDSTSSKTIKVCLKK